ncbi:MAG: tetratricopeptide repeat protein, partial [Nitrospinota bacterium]|nr:tetratricopeptide repeat protein [Nitrospinota bacterium]
MKIKLILIAFVFIFLSTEYTGNFSVISVANAQEQQSRKTKRVGSMSEKVAKKLGEAQELIEAEQIQEGIEILNEILSSKRLSDYERAQVYYFLAYTAYLQEDYKKAINFYKRVLSEEAVPEGLLSAARFTIAQLWFQLEDWDKAISAVDDLLATEESPRPDLYILKGSALYQLKKYEELIPVIQSAIDLAESRNAFRIEQLQKNIKSTADENGIRYLRREEEDKNEIDYFRFATQVEAELKEDLSKTRKAEQKTEIQLAIDNVKKSASNLTIGPTKENWWLLLRAAYFELDNIPKVRYVLERLLIEWSKKEYWTQLAAIYGQDELEEKQISAYATAYQEGFLEKSNEYVQMAQLYLSKEVPHKAAVVLQTGFDEGIVDKEVKNWRLLSQAWFLAQEDQMAIIALREAAKLSDDGELDVRLARSLANIADYKSCVDAAQTGIQKGGLKRDDESYITLGMCQFEEDMYEDSKNSFKLATNDATARREAALEECSIRENMTKEDFLILFDRQARWEKIGKELENKRLICSLPSSYRTATNWQKFLDKEVERVTLLQKQ